ncbi:hypothetical protein M407DRAFT_20382 [Tulasnella calospora MUT 4182]|uniref:Uncharacterized protein n=1 Tax=Tulasnella calospora MUT 4182 TaxID=1051891 RepID=A0A0C3QRN7_9AGAM|nr:hypothetical protein M407DRAFT_20382 [Tulasnella calospora MUT 4182]
MAASSTKVACPAQGPRLFKLTPSLFDSFWTATKALITSSTVMLSQLRSVFQAHSVLTTWIAFSITVPGAIIALMFRASTYELDALKESVQGQEGIVVQGHIYQIDTHSKTISISWVIAGCGSYKVQNSKQRLVAGTCRMLNRPIDVYVDGGTAQNGTVWSYDPSLHPKDSKTGQILYVQAHNEFQTTHLLNIIATEYLGHQWDQEHKYPNDQYFWTTSLVLVNPRNVSEDIPIIRITATDLSNNFIPHVVSEIPITQTLVTLDGSLRSLSGRVVNVCFDRNPTTKTFVIIIFVVNWALTLVVFHITVLSLVSRDVTVSEGVLVLPVTVILTIPALRSLFVENPAFGIYLDNVGLFLQMIITSVCSIVLLVNRARYHSTDKHARPRSLASVIKSPTMQSRASTACNIVQVQRPLTRRSHEASAQELEQSKQSQHQP